MRIRSFLALLYCITCSSWTCSSAGRTASLSIWSCYTASSLNYPSELTRPLWIDLIWYLRLELRLKRLLQKTHSKGFSFIWILYVWSFRCEIDLKAFPQLGCVQRNGRTPSAWVKRWFFKCCFCLKDLSQPSKVHWNCRSWHLRCQSSLHLLMNYLLGHMGHLNFSFYRRTCASDWETMERCNGSGSPTSNLDSSSSTSSTSWFLLKARCSTCSPDWLERLMWMLPWWFYICCFVLNRCLHLIAEHLNLYSSCTDKLWAWSSAALRNVEYPIFEV